MTSFLQILWNMALIVLCAGLAWFVYRFVYEIECRVNRYNSNLSMFTKVMRIAVVVIIVILILQNIGVQLSGVLTISAAGSFILALGAKDVLYNLGGGLMLQIDRVFAEGDLIRVQYSTNSIIEGVVENIGWRLTRLKTKEGKAMYVPNVIFVTMPLENLSRNL